MAMICDSTILMLAKAVLSKEKEERVLPGPEFSREPEALTNKIKLIMFFRWAPYKVQPALELSPYELGAVVSISNFTTYA